MITVKAPVWKIALSAIATAALATQGLLGLAAPANADPNQNATVSWIKTGQAVAQTALDGSLYNKRCANGQSSDTVTHISPTNGDSLATVNAPTSSTACATDVIAGQNGQFFTLEMGKVLGYDSSGERIWTAEVGTCSMWGSPMSLITTQYIKLGADGNLYALKGGNSECTSATPPQLIKIDTSTTNTTTGGTVTVLATLSGYLNDMATDFKTISTYKSGVAIYELVNLNGGKGIAEVRFFDLKGIELSSKKLNLTDVMVDRVPEVSHDGGVAYIKYGYEITCTYDALKVNYVSPSGVATKISEPCSEDTQSIRVSFALDGAIQVATQRNSDSHYLHAVYLQSGTVVYQQDLSTFASGITSLQSFSDQHGNTLHLINVNYQHSILVLVNNTGTVMSTFDTRNEPNASTTSIGIQRVFLTDGYVYANVCVGSCSNMSLYKISMTTVDTDYPRVGTLDPSANGKLHYVALGDSYSSGEGNPDFHAGTAVPGVNTCHRSDDAYAYKLVTDTSLNLDLYDFRACSGATTDNVINGQHNEASQLNALNTETDIVTISIGGNNVGFKPFMTACLTPDQTCAQGSTEYNNTKSSINNTLASKVSTLLDEIANKIGPNTKVLVVGYPMLVQEFSQSWSNCALTSQGDRNAIMEMTTLMNSKLAATIDSFNDDDVRFHYVTAMGEDSPFEGHDMCSAESDNYILEWNFGDPEEYIAHPDKDGHLAYAEIIKDYIVTHNLTTGL